ncbi:MAG: hypothetical protein HRU70_07105 [Phycisphaeraceae bacterium]|nr:MAG: hypothetical protein HRU70_07105 [Phycisphaeraceae bacterium]
MKASRTILSGVMVSAGLALSAAGQTAPASTPPEPATPVAQDGGMAPASGASRTSDIVMGSSSRVNPGFATLNNMMKRVTIELSETRLEDAINFIRTVTGVDMEVFWAEDRDGQGLDKDFTVSLNVRNATALSLLEKLLEKAGSAMGGTNPFPNTWQLNESGGLVVGPKERLNRYKTLVIYDINDLLFDFVDKTNAPTFDLNSAFQSGGGGGGGQSPFQNQGGQDQNADRRTKEEKARDIQKLITDLVETEQWVDNGGDGASVRYWNGAFLINAPDYIHRQIVGYRFWPASATRSGTAGGRRYVTLDGTYQQSSPARFRTQSVPAIVGPGGR